MNEPQTQNTDGKSAGIPGPPFNQDTVAAALGAENEQLKRAIRLRDAREALTKSLTAAGGRSPQLLFDSVTEKLQFDENGEVRNAEALVGMLKQSYPEQFIRAADSHAAGPVSIDGGAGVGQPATPLTREALAGMTAGQIAQLDWADVRAVLSK
jgi:hypothetical protein